jgi:O-antigen/teichoic acid export membrane protein
MAGGRLTALAGQSLIYGLGGILARAVGFVLVPIYLHATGSAAFGTVELMMAAVMFASILLRMGIVTSMSRFTLGEQGKGSDDYGDVMHTIFVFVMIAATAGVIIGFLLRGWIAEALQVPDNIVLAGLFGLWVSMNYDVMARVYRVERRARAWVQFTLLNVALTAVLTLILVLHFNQGALGLMVGNFTGTAIVYAILLVLRRESVGVRRFNSPVMRELLIFSLPLMPANIALWALNLADRIQIQRLVDPVALGAYSGAARVAVAMGVIVGAFQTAWAPFAHSVRGEEGDEIARQTYGAVLTYWAIVMGWGLVAVSLVAPPYIRISFPESAQSAIPVVPLLSAGIVLYGGYLIVNIGVTVSRRTRMTPIICTIAAVTNLGLNFWFIPQYGIVGAGITTVIGYAVLLWLGWWNAQRSYPVPYDWKRVGRVAGVAIVFLALSNWVVPQEGHGAIVIRAALIAVFPLVLVALGGITRRDIRRAMEMVSFRRGGGAAVTDVPP